MVHVEKLQGIERLVGRLAHAVLLHVLLGRQVLLDDRADDRGRRQQDQRDNRQLQGTEKIPQLIGKTLLFAQKFSPKLFAYVFCSAF